LSESTSSTSPNAAIARPQAINSHNRAVSDGDTKTERCRRNCNAAEHRGRLFVPALCGGLRDKTKPVRDESARWRQPERQTQRDEEMRRESAYGHEQRRL